MQLLNDSFLANYKLTGCGYTFWEKEYEVKYEEKFLFNGVYWEFTYYIGFYRKKKEPYILFFVKKLYYHC